MARRLLFLALALASLLDTGCARFKANMRAAVERCEEHGGEYNMVKGGCVYRVEVVR